MTNQERITNVRALGYTEREAEFLCLAALHSGYFVRRQYLAFAGQTWGKTDATLAEKLLGNGHAKALEFRHKRTVFSFCSKPFYAALGDADNRNRRSHEVQTVKCRLIALDFVLAHQHLAYLATEYEKVACFRDQFKVEAAALPAKIYRSARDGGTTARHFVDKFPVAIEAGPVVFTYIDDGAHSTSGFENHLRHYQPLLVRLPSFRLLYIAPFPTHFEPARRLFGRLMAGSGVPADLARMLEHFADRDAYERKDLARFDQRKLIQFREDRQRFSGAEAEELFRRWQHGGASSVTHSVASTTKRTCEFGTWLSPFRYELFGTLGSEASERAS